MIIDDYGRKDYLYLEDTRTVIGGVQKYIQNSELDCLLVNFSSPSVWSPNDRVYNYLNKSIPGVITGLGGVVTALEGSSIRKYGISTGREDGQIISSYYSVDSYINQMLSSAITSGGDSGGPVGKWTTASPNTMTLYGITRAKVNSNSYNVACKATSALSGLGVSLYVK